MLGTLSVQVFIGKEVSGMDGISSSVAQYSMASSGAALQQQVSLSVAKKAMDTAESQAQTLINDMLQGVNHANGLGNLVDVLA